MRLRNIFLQFRIIFYGSESFFYGSESFFAAPHFHEAPVKVSERLWVQQLLFNYKKYKVGVLFNPDCAIVAEPHHFRTAITPAP
jgi:hypothetical protein